MIDLLSITPKDKKKLQKAFANIQNISIFAHLKGGLAQLVQSICLTSRGSLVRIQ